MADYSFSRIQDYIAKVKNNEDVTDFLLKHPKTKEDAIKWDYKYWKTQPVTQIGKVAPLPKIINKEILNKHKEEVKMLEPYTWKNFDLNNDADMEEVVKFINKYNVSDENSKFKYVYTKENIKYMLSHKQNRGYIFGMTATSNKDETSSDKNSTITGGIVCFTIKKLQLFDLVKDVGSVKYIGIHPKLRDKGLAKILMNETIRRLTAMNIEMGDFRTNLYIPTPVCKVEYYYRPINYKKMYELGYVKLENVKELKRAIDEYKVDHIVKSKGVKLSSQPIEKMKQAYDILCDYQDKYNIYEKYTLEEFIHTFMNNKSISSYVILNEDGDVQDFYSYTKYGMKSLEKNDSTDSIRVAKIHTYTSTEITPLSIFKSAIIDASNESIDLFTSTDVMENLEVLYDNFNKFVKGETFVHYNFYNWECPELSPEQVCYQ
ncbi:MAG: N-myristoyltransferase [Terrestrivirus sp.]|uniref:glycylpeptide N-tetradecanoyltransferase n=1 Tax=Terrestrivirus sp. TaxID=2487775 RepID=A0A3G4ZNM7_9VIRU|nr:MAG: N-myristoyltransferase [Terrestrivirus sp.]